MSAGSSSHDEPMDAVGGASVRARIGRLARIGSIFSLLLVVAACSSTAATSPTVVTRSAVARAGQAAVRLEDGRVLILGGRTPYKGVCPMACIEPVTASVEVYDP